ncbi:zinc-binding metallopeptidase family protein [Rhizobium sp. G187]|uniref:zinc-binding metallopeptidase family protein n=1 Tax=Rhizobium sp. G187 TaxID=3451352 RepID=UPI003EE8112B
MRLFNCTNCSNVVHFENTGCVSCHARLAFKPSELTMVALDSGNGALLPAVNAQPVFPKRCVNAEVGGCNWLVEDDDETGFCIACRHNVTIPDLSVSENVENWQKIELAKRGLFYSLLRFRLPLVTRRQDPENGLGFDFLAEDPQSSDDEPILTGHADGLITLNVVEAHDAEREARRVALGEPFRTLLGHFRHEIAHYYWNVLIRDRDAFDACRAVFGDERADYGAALNRHYREGPQPGWEQSFISAYAASHPWEDFAETFAHYFHIVDALDTADAFGLRTNPDVETTAENIELKRTFDSYRSGSAQTLIRAWVPLTLAINSINRSMGQPDLYPFVMSEAVFDKLAYIHQLIRSEASSSM